MNCYIDTEPTTSPGLPYTGPCRHEQVDVGKAEVQGTQAITSVLCLACGLSWQRCSIVGAKMLPAERR